MRKHLARRWKWMVAALAIALTCLAVGVSSADAEPSCAKPAALGLYASSFMDTTLNPADAEDIEFLTRAGGVPNVMLMLDTSRPMIRLPGDGPASLEGAASHPAGKFGCGIDPETSASLPVQAVLRRRYASPCGDALGTTSTYGQAFQGDVDYAQEASVCPWFTTGTATNAGGFDPDFYFGSDADTLAGPNQRPNFFDKDMVFHDAAASSTPLSFAEPSTVNLGITDGWSWDRVLPHQTNNTVTGNMKISTVEDFCGGMPSATMKDSCTACMTQRGFFFDGNMLTDGTRKFPSIWYTGNYLNFFPPKFLIARKVMKDVLSVRREIRGALARLNSDSGGQIVQQFNPPCDQPDPSSFFNNRSTYVNAINAMTFTDRPVFAEALLDVGQYYHSTDLPWFGTGFSNRTPWAAGQAPGSNSNAFSICYPCQTSSVILFSGGLARAGEDVNLPFGPVAAADVDPNGGKYAGDPSTGILKNPEATSGGIPESLCPECSAFSGTDDYKNNLPRVAWYLHNLDLRKNTEATKDCGPRSGSNLTNGGKQTLDIYTVGFGTSTAPDGNAILANTAAAGGGAFVAADDAAGLRTAVEFILRTINERSTSFSVATVSRLQTQTGQSVIVPRFDPVKGAFWKGHLFRYDLYSEFVNGCTPNGTGDLDCDGTCTGVFLTDSTGKFIQEDASGKFMRNEPNVPACNQSMCSGCGVAGNVPATPHWDAGEKTKAQSWKTRKLYTAIDTTEDGRVDDEDGLTELNADDATATLLRPYMNVQGSQTCALLAAKLMTARDPGTAAAINADLATASPTYLTCVKTIIRYLRGADVFNEGKLAVPGSWPKADPADLPDRQWKLGDIFHSSPVVVDPPLPSDGVLCARGLHNQCIPSLWSTAVKHEVAAPPLTDTSARANANAYDDYAKNDRYEDRRKIVLVGANDGFIHAFDAGSWQDGDDDLLTPGLDESLPPFNGYYDRGEGTELWAVMPPDQLAKVHLHLLSSSHQYAVDGTAMVRDVWVDGTVNGLGGTAAKDGKKQGREFHTVAVMSMRRGGTHYFALDVTDATKLPTESGFSPPKFLWLYPQPDTRDILEFGETYSDFLPTPPPIGPVRVAASEGEPDYDATLVYTNSSNAAVPFNERWIVALSGGFDPHYVRGRGVHLVDVWTGKEVFGFTKPLPGSSTPSDDPRWNLNYPVAANVGMVMWGKNARLQSAFPPNEGYFDTATFGDVGGQLWVLRFNDPAVLDADGRATNWLGARAFQMDSGAGLCANQPFFYITANVALANTGIYRVLAGTGDRFNLLDRAGGTCGPDNIRACVQRGCSVTLDRTRNHLAANVGDSQRGLSAATCGAAPTYSEADGAGTTCAVNGEVNVAITCGNQTTTKSVSATCTASGDGYGCNSVVSSLGDQLEYGTSTQGNWFFSVTVFDTTGVRTVFDTPAQAKAYDTARLTVGSLTQIDGGTTTPTPADATGLGWAMSFNHSGTIPVGAVSYTANRLDERVSSPTAAANSCVFWNTTQRAGSVASNNVLACIASKCTQEDRRLQHFYGADAGTGALCLTQPGSTGTQVRSIASATLVPPPAPQFTAFVNQYGQVSFGLTSINTETGAQNRGVGGVTDAASLLEWIEIDRDLHACRHAGATTSAVCR